MDWIRSELADGDTPYGKLNEEQQLYIWYVYTSLKDRGVFNTSNVDTTDDVYKDWTQADGTSLKELLTHGIAKNWINLNVFSTEQYTSLQESYDALLDYIDGYLREDTSFYKKMYKYMINSGSISGRQVCMLLYEQGYLKKNTIHPNEGIVGYMNIKRKKGNILTINIPINGNVYSFELDVNKKNNK